ncbi:MAG: hypothetical protein ACLTW9_19255 [Enterocloster sp.]
MEEWVDDLEHGSGAQEHHPRETIQAGRLWAGTERLPIVQGRRDHRQDLIRTDHQWEDPDQ